MKRWAAIAAGAALSFALGMAAGWRLVPARVEERVVERTVVDQQAIAAAVQFARTEWKRDTKSTTRVVYRDGKPVERIVYWESAAAGGSTSSASSASQSTTHIDAQREAQKVTERVPFPLSASLSVGYDPLHLHPRPNVTGDLSYRLLGPLSMYATATAWEAATSNITTEAGLRISLP